MTKVRLHVIEPTLQDYTGHCHSYVSSLLAYAQEYAFDVTVWAGKRAKSLDFGPALDDPKCFGETIKPFFIYRIRKLQQIWLYKKLIRENQPIFIPTANSFDIKILHDLLKKRKYSDHYNQFIFLHFHQFRQSQRKLALMQAFQDCVTKAGLKASVVFMTPTERLSAVLQSSGLESVHTVPCPVYNSATASTEGEQAKKAEAEAPIKLLYTGAARNDKGFYEVVQLIKFLQQQQQSENNPQMPVYLQASASHNGKYDQRTQQALAELKQVDYDGLTVSFQSLDQMRYLSLFERSICLLLYDQKEYADKFSGVTLEAIYNHAPIITVANTWMGDLVDQYQVGVALENRTPQAVYSAAQLIYQNYETYKANTLKAKDVLSGMHHPRTTLNFLQTQLLADKTKKTD